MIKNPLISWYRLILILSLLTSNLQGQLLELKTTHNGNGRYTYSFCASPTTLSWGLSQNHGKIFFEIPDATEITVPNDWVVTKNSVGFNVSYKGPFHIYPLGHETLDISFNTKLELETSDLAERASGTVYGIVILNNGFYRSSAQRSHIVGYEIFNYNQPSYVGEPVPTDFLIEHFDYAALSPAVSEIKRDRNEVTICLTKVIPNSTYILEFNRTLKPKGWVQIFTFSNSDLSENGELRYISEDLHGFFRVSLL